MPLHGPAGTPGMFAWQDDINANKLDRSEASSTYVPLPATTEMVLYVSTGAKGNDANNGLSWGAPKATVGAALTTLGSNPGTVHLGVGNHVVSAADSHGNGVTLTTAGQHIEGRGLTTTTLTINTDATWGVQALAASCRVEGLLVILATGKTVTYGVGVSTPASTGSAEHCNFTDLYVSCRGTTTAAYALGPDWPGSSAVDIAYTTFTRCAYDGAPVHGWLQGNGTGGNVTANNAHECVGWGGQYGISINGGGFHWYGGAFAATTVADIHLMHSSADPIIFKSMRNENGVMAVDTEDGGPSGGLTLDDCSFAYYTPSDGVSLIRYANPGPFKIIGGYYATVAGNTLIKVNPDAGIYLQQFTAIGVLVDSVNPFPVASPNLQRVITGCSYMLAGIPTPNPYFGGLVVDGLVRINKEGATPAPYTVTGTTAMSIVGNEYAGIVNFTTVAGVAADTAALCVLYPAYHYGLSPRVVITPLSGASAAAQAYLGFEGAGFWIYLHNPPAGATAMSFSYQMVTA